MQRSNLRTHKKTKGATQSQKGEVVDCCIEIRTEPKTNRSKSITTEGRNNDS
jgi:hypothetical protein